MSSHARLSPSAAHRWSVCPAAPREEAKYPDSSGPAAIDGTHSHTLLETCLNMRLRSADPFVGEVMNDDDGPFKVDADRAERVNVALDYIWKRYDELSTPDELPEIITEQKVNPGTYMGRTDCKGTCDVQIKTRSYLEIIDYKDGMNPVPAENNKQLILYATGAIMEDRRYECLIFRVQMTIIQPKLRFKGTEPISTWIIESATLRDLADELTEAAKRTDADDAPFVPGDHCKFCKHTACTARMTDTMEKSGISFDNLDKVVEMSNSEPTDMTDDQIRNILESAPMIKQMIEVAEAEALRRFESGKVIDGLKVVHGRGSNNWAFDDDQMVEKLKKMGIPKASCYVTKLVSPAAVKKLKWEKRNGEVKQLSDRQLKTLESEYIKKTAGKLTVVSESDHRQAVVFDASPMFESVGDGLPDWLS